MYGDGRTDVTSMLYVYFMHFACKPIKLVFLVLIKSNHKPIRGWLPSGSHQHDERLNVQKRLPFLFKHC